jgi:hypothetical protein
MKEEIAKDEMLVIITFENKKISGHRMSSLLGEV